MHHQIISLSFCKIISIVNYLFLHKSHSLLIYVFDESIVEVSQNLCTIFMPIKHDNPQ